MLWWCLNPKPRLRYMGREQQYVGRITLTSHNPNSIPSKLCLILIRQDGHSEPMPCPQLDLPRLKVKEDVIYRVQSI